MDWDGEPVYQSQRLDLYEQAMKLIPCGAPAAGASPDSGTASHAPFNTPLIPPSGTTGTGWQYPCFCSRADIRAASAPQEGDGFQIYPGTCHTLAVNEPQESARRVDQHQRHSWRLAMPSPGTPANTVTFIDRVFGMQTYDLAHSIGDSIIRRSDGLFSYQLVVVVDDLDMGVDDIVRGRDLLRSNALQIAIRRALIKAGFRKAKTQASAPSQHAPQSQHTPYNPENPRYAHLPLIDNAAGRRLAKRERSLDMGALRAHGVTAEQVVGYCAWLLGLQGDSAHTSPQPMSAVEALQEFDWGKVRADTADRSISQDDFDAYFGL